MQLEQSNTHIINNSFLPFKGDGNCHENRSSHSNCLNRIQHIRKKDDMSMSFLWKKKDMT